VAERFWGRFDHTVDQKGRVSIPADFRRVLEEGDRGFRERQPAQPFVFIVELPKMPYLTGLTVTGWHDFMAGFDAIADPAERRYWLRTVPQNSLRPQLDENGRIVLSREHRRAAGLGDRVRFVGSFTRFEVWDPERHDAEMAEAALGRTPDDPFQTTRIPLRGDLS
jgi:MraZ protein